MQYIWVSVGAVCVRFVCEKYCKQNKEQICLLCWWCVWCLAEIANMEEWFSILSFTKYGWVDRNMHTHAHHTTKLLCNK